MLVALLAVSSRAQAFLDTLDDKFFFECAECQFRTDLSVLADLEAYTIDERPPGLLFSNHDVLIQPRLSLFLDTTLGKHFYSFVQFRVDRGFDPGSMPNGDARFDEYLIRYTPLNDSRVNVQIGKFATVYGSWVKRHDSWNNPFINAPLPYENFTTVTDHAAPPSIAGFLGRRASPDKKDLWLPIIWGPSYTSGAAAFGTVERFDYGFEVKNASLSSRPREWDGMDLGWSNPTMTGRVGYRPNATWDIGANGSYGSYLLPLAQGTLPAGDGVGDYKQITVGPDISFAWRHVQVWAEAMASRFEVPRVGNADTVAYYIEGKYKFTPKLFGGVRWNQQLYDTVTNAAGAPERWDHDAWRAEAAIGYRFTRHLQTKVQYSYSHQRAAFQQGEQMAAVQLTMKF